MMNGSSSNKRPAIGGVIMVIMELTVSIKPYVMPICDSWTSSRACAIAMGRLTRKPPSKKYPRAKKGIPVPFQIRMENKMTKACAAKYPLRGFTRLNVIAISEFPNAPMAKIKPVWLNESPRTPSKKFGVSGWARYIEKKAKASTPIRTINRLLFLKLGGGESGSWWSIG